MKSKRRGSGTPRAFSCSTTDVSWTRWISGAVAAGSNQKVSSVYSLKAFPGASRPVSEYHRHQEGCK